MVNFAVGVVFFLPTAAVELLMKAGAHAIKLEGVKGNESLISHIVDSGVPVMGHLGLTPQSVNQFGGFKVQGKTDAAQQQIIKDTLTLEELGCFSVVLECVPDALTRELVRQTSLITIGRPDSAQIVRRHHG